MVVKDCYRYLYGFHLNILYLACCLSLLVATSQAVDSETYSHFKRDMYTYQLSNQSHMYHYSVTYDVQWYCFSPYFNDSVFDCCGMQFINCTESGPVLKVGICATFDGQQLSIAHCEEYFEHIRLYNITNSGYMNLPIRLTDLNENMCGPLNRKGVVCSECIDGFGLSVSSFGYKCTNCSGVWYTVPLTLFLEFVPVTILYLFIMVFQISVTSPPMPCFIMTAQFILYTVDSHRIDMRFNDYGGTLSLIFEIVRTFYGLFNLEFFRYITPSICLSSRLKSIHITFLRYIIAFYPLFLIFLTWIVVKLHDRNMRLIVCLWRPFHKCFVRIRKRWNSKTDLVDVFITFLILSCYKFISLVSELLRIEYITKYDNFGNMSTTTQAKVDLNLSYLSSNHLPYLLISLLFAVIFTILPPLLLLLYPIKMFRSCLSKCGLNSFTITVFTDKIQSCYWDGLDEGRDTRSFSAFYFILRVSFHILSIIFHDTLKRGVYTSLGITFSISSLIVALIRPYKKTYMTILDSLLLINIALLCFSRFQKLVTVLLLTAPICGLTLLFLLRKFNQNQLLLKSLKRVKSIVCCRYLCRLRTRPTTESSQNSDSVTNVLSPIATQPLVHVMPNEISNNYGTYQ